MEFGPVRTELNFIFHPRFLAVLEIQFVWLTPCKQILIESRHQYQHNTSLTMATSDAPALNPDSTLKDASEIEWLNSPSDENRTVSLEDPKNCKRTNSEHNTDELPSALKEKAPARHVGTKRVKILSKNVQRMAVENNQFSVGSPHYNKISSRITFKASITLTTSTVTLLTYQCSRGCFKLWCVPYFLSK